MKPANQNIEGHPESIFRRAARAITWRNTIRGAAVIAASIGVVTGFIGFDSNTINPELILTGTSVAIGGGLAYLSTLKSSYEVGPKIKPKPTRNERLGISSKATNLHCTYG